MSLQKLEDLVDDILVDGLNPAIKDAIDALIGRGVTRRELERAVRRWTGGPRANPGAMTYHAVMAYADRKLGVPRAAFLEE